MENNFMNQPTTLNRKYNLRNLLICLAAIACLAFPLYSSFVSQDTVAISEQTASAQTMFSPTPCSDPTNARCVGSWSKPYSAPVTAVHTFVMPSGKVMFFPSNNNKLHYTNAYLWDPANPKVFTAEKYCPNGSYCTQDATPLPSPAAPPPTDGNLFCAGHDFLQDGRLLITGGHNAVNSGIANTTIFDSRNIGTTAPVWSAAEPMDEGRWYPTNCTLGNGEQLVMMGNKMNGDLNYTLEVWRNRNKWTTLPSLYPGRIPHSYPYTFLTDKGRVFIAGPSHRSYFIKPEDGASFPGKRSDVPLRDYGSAVMYKEGKVLITGGGGNFGFPSPTPPPNQTAEIIDVSNVTDDCDTMTTNQPTSCPAWTNVDDMKLKRRQHNATVLPDGQVLVTGGSSGLGFSDHGTGVLPAEIWNPDAAAGEQWTELAPMTHPRLYHSSAVLLPDARVAVGGGDWIVTHDARCDEVTRPPGQGTDYYCQCESFGCQPESDCKGATAGDDDNCNVPEKTIEVFSPPYLFNSDGSEAARPEITSAPLNVGYNKTFSVGVNTPTNSNWKVSWVRLSAVTHSFNQGQRINNFVYQDKMMPTATGFNLTTPVNGNYCPPGYYMLFVTNPNGVPSKAKIIQITDKEASNKFELDRDRKTDLTVWRPNNGYWYTNKSTDGSNISSQLGASSDKPVPADYDGDGLMDHAVWRPSNGTWYIVDSSDNTFSYKQFGVSADVPVPADYDGDRLTDFAVFRPSDGTWYLQRSQAGFTAVSFGAGTDLPAPGYYDDDSKADVAVWRPGVVNGNWYVLNSTNGQIVGLQQGKTGDYIVPNDYDGDTKTDYAVWRPSDGTWYINNSSNNSNTSFPHGANGDIPIAADYDGDGRADKAVWRAGSGGGEWHIVRSSTGLPGTTQYGTTTDIPIPSIYYRH
jgi:hypothetical protein